MAHPLMNMSEDELVDWGAAKAALAPDQAPAEAPGEDEGVEAAPGDEVAEQHTAEDTDALVEVSLKGRKLRLPREDAAAIEDFRREVRDRDGRLGGENAQLRERLARLEGALLTRQPEQAPPAVEEIAPPAPELAVTNLAEWQRQMLRYTAKMVERSQSELAETYAKDQRARAEAAEEAARNQAWAHAFYTRHPQFKTPALMEVVGEVYSKHASDLETLSDPDAQFERLASLAGERVLAIRQAGKNLNPSRPPKLEGASTPVAKRPVAADSERAFSAADFVRQERARLRGEVTS
jgi:hypothetical protein